MPDLSRFIGLKDKGAVEKTADTLGQQVAEGTVLGGSPDLQGNSSARQPWILVLVLNLFMALALMMLSAHLVMDTSGQEAPYVFWRALLLGSRPTDGMLSSWGPGAIVAVTGMIGLVIFSMNAESPSAKQSGVSRTVTETIRFGSRAASDFGFPLLAICSTVSIAMLISTLRSGHNAPFILMFCIFNILVCVNMQSTPALRGHILREHKKDRLIRLRHEIGYWSKSSIDDCAEKRLWLRWFSPGFICVKLFIVPIFGFCGTGVLPYGVRSSLLWTCSLLLVINVLQQLLAVVEKYDPLEKLTMRRYFFILFGLLHASIVLATLERYSMNDTEVAITLGLTSMVSAFAWSVWLGLLFSKEYRSWDRVKKCKAWVELTSVKEKPQKDKWFGKTKSPLSAEEVKDGTRTVWDLFSEIPARVRGDSKIEAKIRESRAGGWVPVAEADS